jgi:aspartate beta-hydroxylase
MSRPEQLQAIAAEATRLGAAGDREQSLRLWRQVLTADPRHGPALNAVGNALLGRGDVAAAVEHLERARAVAADQAAVRFNLAQAYRAAGRAADALAELDAALRVDPYFVQAMYLKGLVLESQGRLREAAPVFAGYLKCAPPEVQQAPRFAAALSHAREVVDANAAALAQQLDGRFRAYAAAHPDRVVPRRFSESVDILLGRQPAYVSKATFLQYPRLPAIPFFERAATPWLDALERHADEIRGELLRLLAAGDADGPVPYVDVPAGMPLDQWAELHRSSRWSAFFLWKSGERVAANCARCPVTAAAVEALPLARIPARGPTVFFSLLQPRTRIPPHTGVTNVRCGVHLPLIVPPGCGFRVGAERRAWLPGEAWVFDDTIDHEAWNDSDELRAILILDVWNPLLDATERELVCETIAGFDAYYGRGRPWADV